MGIFSGLGLLLILSVAAHAATFTIDRDQSIFAVITHKGGIAARLAHNHIVYPKDYKADLSLDGNDVTQCRFKLNFPVDHLQNDTLGMQVLWFPKIKKAGILDEAFEAISDQERAKIRHTMLGSKQLDAKDYPEIRAVVKRISKRTTRVNKQTYDYVVTLAFTVHSKTVERDIPARIRLDNDVLNVTAIGEYKFTEFGIKPYSAMLGAVRNRDTFNLFISLRATRNTK